MQAKRIFLVGAVAVASLFHIALLKAGPVNWTGAGDGVYWTNVNNWAGNAAPSPSDDAIINGVSTNVTIILGDNVSVASVQ